MDVFFPKAFSFLFRPARYKVAYGGRGSGKSWSVARALILKSVEKKLFIACLREYQNSMEDSVHKLLKDQIEALGLSNIFNVMKNRIVCTRNGSEFVFRGFHNDPNAIRSLEGADIAWVEEAQAVTKKSWSVLIPTLRQNTSEIWVTFNPELDTDETYKRFVKDPPPDAVVRHVNWDQNPWFPEVLRSEMDYCLKTDPDEYHTTWAGHPRRALVGAVFAEELRKAESEGRVGRVPHSPSHPVHTFWDLGWSDKTSIWFVQAIGFEYRFINFYQDRHKDVPHYLRYMQTLPYLWGTDYLPHDASSETLSNSGRGVDQQFRSAGRTVKIVPRTPAKSIMINAARSMFPAVHFDADDCAEGLDCLRRYRYGRREKTGSYTMDPVHDDASHGADAFMTAALSLGLGRDGSKTPRSLPSTPRNVDNIPSAGGGWMKA